jgi:glycosyltransferase involved in cell wall biosynthesis
MAVEYGVGYGGTFSKYKVFESYAWMHMHYGAASYHNLHAATGNWWDVVIPGYLDPEMFPFSGDKEDYFLYIGRLVDNKGYSIAVEVCKKLGKRLLIAGQGDPPSYGEYLGVVGPEERGRIMSKAQAVFVPTIYVEPFGNVAVEAQACGTPVICTDWGAMTETVDHGVTGFRCRTFSEFVRATEDVKNLNYYRIRDRAISRYGLAPIGAEYERYFNRLLTLWREGWYA